MIFCWNVSVDSEQSTSEDRVVVLSILKPSSRLHNWAFRLLLRSPLKITGTYLYMFKLKYKPINLGFSGQKNTCIKWTHEMRFFSRSLPNFFSNETSINLKHVFVWNSLVLRFDKWHYLLFCIPSKPVRLPIYVPSLKF